MESDPPAAASAPRLPYLDGLRALGAAYVVMFHAVLGFTAADLTGSWRVLRRVFAFGHEAVAIFIVLSGYCLMLPAVRFHPARLSVTTRTFLRRRALRILPPYFGALAVSLVLIAEVDLLRVRNTGTTWDDSLPGLALGPIVSHVVLLHNWFPSWSSQINGPLWSVATEWQIYFFFPLLLLPLWRRLGMLATLAAATALGYAPLLFAPASAKVAIPWYILLFVFGMAAAAVGFSPSEVHARLRREVRWGPLCGALWTLCATGGLLAAPIWFRWKPVTDALIGLATATLLVHLTSRAQSLDARRSGLLRVLESGPLVTLGRFSYSLYLTHLPVVALCFFALRPLGGNPVTLTLALLVTGTSLSLVVAYVFHLGIERPFMLRR